MAHLLVPTRLCFVLAVAFSMTTSTVVFAQTAAEAAARQADVLQRQNQERISRDIENALPPDRTTQGIDTRTLCLPWMHRTWAANAMTSIPSSSTVRRT